MNPFAIECDNCIKANKCDTYLTLHPNDPKKDGECIAGICFALPVSLLIWFIVIKFVFWLT